MTDPLIVLVHIPKTGGTSLRVAAEQYFGKKKMLYDYGTQARLTSSLVREWVYERQDMAGFAEAVRESGVRFFSGHFHFSRYRDVLADARFVSWIREPSARIWSAWRHYRRHHGFEGSFQAFYSSDRFQNQQHRFLGGDLEPFEFIGLTERFGPSLNRFNRIFGVNLVQHRANKTPPTRVDRPGPEDLERISELNRADLEVYRAVEEIFDRSE